MVRACVYPSCENKMTSWTKFSFHRLPFRDPDTLKLWLVALKMDPNMKVRALRRLDHRVCSAHFSVDDYFPVKERKEGQKIQRMNLKRNAIPMASEENTDTAEPLANTALVVKTEYCEDFEEKHPVTPEPAVKKLLLLNPSESVYQEYQLFTISPHEVKQETSAASVQLSENGKSGKRDAAYQRLKRRERSEDLSTTLSVGDGRYLVDLGSSSEVIVDEECILQLFRSCRKCSRQCAVRKHVQGLKLVVSQACCFCESRSKWTNLPDEDDDGDFHMNGEDTVHGQSS